MTNAERQFLWKQYPEVRQLYEEFNDTPLEDDDSWALLVKRCHEIADDYPGNKIVEVLLCDAAHQLERLAKLKRSQYS